MKLSTNRNVTAIAQIAISLPCFLPLFISKVSAGFPSPAEDYIDEPLDLNTYLITHPAATFFVRAIGDSMLGAGIFPNDILIIDRSLKPISGKIIIAAIDGELTVKRLKTTGKKIYLLAENPYYKPIEIRDGQEFEVWGVVTCVLHQV